MLLHCGEDLDVLGVEEGDDPVYSFEVFVCREVAQGIPKKMGDRLTFEALLLARGYVWSGRKGIHCTTPRQ